MQIGIHAPHLGRELDPGTVRSFVKECDALDVHSLWVSDHVCWPADIVSKYPYTDDGSFPASPEMGWLDPIGTLLFIAGCTDRVRLGTTVLILPYRPPVATAKQLATLDVVSNGRLILGVGIGWMAEEAAVLGMPWDHRGRRSDEQLEIFQRLFTEPEPSFQGEFYRFPKVGFEPKPVQQPVPVWVGGSTTAAFRRVARFGQAFHAAFQPLEEVRREWQAVHAECEVIGRDPAEVGLSLRLYLDPDSRMEPEKSVAGSPAEMHERLAELEAAGVGHVVLDPVARGGVQGRLDAVRSFMTDVVSAS
ncbi:MAG: TIGR03619 family F420-dependent LLM class oxidoreductase [Pseudomonadales bacterium]|nr:LLM class F420-dependent oxidoreductase [Pseudomonadales bacterium]NIX06806.1 TIGR03619 family F420-dependent LLM class oxidoreductase [Pseudomonadales bacterium]